MFLNRVLEEYLTKYKIKVNKDNENFKEIAELNILFSEKGFIYVCKKNIDLFAFYEKKDNEKIYNIYRLEGLKLSFLFSFPSLTVSHCYFSETQNKFSIFFGDKLVIYDFNSSSFLSFNHKNIHTSSFKTNYVSENKLSVYDGEIFFIDCKIEVTGFVHKGKVYFSDLKYKERYIKNDYCLKFKKNNEYRGYLIRKGVKIKEEDFEQEEKTNLLMLDL